MSDTLNIKKSFEFFSTRTKGDRYIWGSVILLVLISLLVVYSATGSLAYKMNHGNTEIYLFKQVFFTVIGLFFGVFVLHRINYAAYSRVAIVAYGLSIILLIYALLFGAEINDGSRWIKVPIINLTIQASDVAKLALFMLLSRMLSRRQEVIKDFKKGFLPLIIPVCITCVLILPANLSNALLTGMTSLVLLYIGRVPFKYLLGVIGIACIPLTFLIIAAVTTYDKKEAVSNLPVDAKVESSGGGIFKRVDTWISRTQDFIYSRKDNKKSAYQVQQAKIAISNGGILFGLGPGNSRQRNFLPQAYNDFIYSIIIEEYGLLGGAVVLLIYFIFLFRCIRIFKRCPYAFGAFLALSLSFTLVIQALANMAVNVNLLPVTGVTLPLISMGGSSFLFTCAAIGIILSVGRNVENLEGKRSRAIVREVEASEEEEKLAIAEK